MILVTGGAFQGKKEYVIRQFGISTQEMTDGAECSWDELRQCRCLVHFPPVYKKNDGRRRRSIRFM